MRYFKVIFFVLLVCLGLVTKAVGSGLNLPYCEPLPPVTTQNDASNKLITTKILAITTTEPSSIQVRCYQEERNQLGTSSILVTDPALQTVLKYLKEGDQVTLGYDLANKNVLKSLSVSTYKVEWYWLIFALLLTPFLIWLLLGELFYSFKPFNNKLRYLIIGQDNRYSNSKTQIVLWFFVLISTYIASIVLRFKYGGLDWAGGVAIPSNLLTLSGLSTGVFVAAKAITESRSESKTRASHPKFPDDLFHNDNGRIDLGDFQMIVVTVLCVLVYLSQVLSFLTVIELHKEVVLPEIDTTLLSTFLLGQGAYLVKKQVGDGDKSNQKKLPKPKVKTSAPNNHDS